jgi:hypothetical protein
VATASPGASPGPGAPVRRTVLGLERQGLGWTLLIAAVALLFAVGLPLADSAVSTEHTAAAGSVANVGLGVRITPNPAWSVVRQANGPAHRAQFTRAGALVTITAVSYSGSLPDAYDSLFRAIDGDDGVQVTSDPQTVTTTSGLVGIASSFAGPAAQGYFAVFAARGVLAVVIAQSPPGAFHAVSGDMLAMISSVGIAAAGP